MIREIPQSSSINFEQQLVPFVLHSRVLASASLQTPILTSDCLLPQRGFYLMREPSMAMPMLKPDSHHRHLSASKNSVCARVDQKSLFRGGGGRGGVG